MILPSTVWMILAAAAAASLAAAAGFYNAVNRRNRNETARQAKAAEFKAAEAELYAAVRGGDANRVRRARLRMQAAR